MTGLWMWRYCLGVVLFACRLKLPRGVILESVYWNSTNSNSKAAVVGVSGMPERHCRIPAQLPADRSLFLGILFPP
ncbi:ephrin-B2a-like [Arapaima gigas]